MKIGDGHAMGGRGGLFERIENAYQEGKVGGPTAGSVAKTAADKAATVARLGGPSRVSGEIETSGRVENPPSSKIGADNWGHIKDPVQSSLLGICADAREGRFVTENELRSAVVETIIEHRYDQHVGPEQSDQIMATLSATLLTDPNFREGIERLLILAAQELG